MKEMKEHPAAKLFPMMTPEEFEGLKTDISIHGQREPIVLHGGLILDGRNRYQACLELIKEGKKIEPRFREFNGRDGESITSFVLSSNLHRRHLDTGQRAMIGVESLAFFEAEAKAAQIEKGKEGGRGKKKTILPNDSKVSRNEQTSVTKAGRALGVSGRTVARAKQVKESAPELAPEVRNGTITLPEAQKVSHYEPDERREVVTRVKTGTAKNVKQAVEQMAAEGRAPVSVSPTVEAKQSPGVKWAREIKKIYGVLTGIEHAGGIQNLSRNWPPTQRLSYAAELRALTDRFNSIIKLLEEAP
jgi:hypothetical protein